MARRLQQVHGRGALESLAGTIYFPVTMRLLDAPLVRVAPRELGSSRCKCLPSGAGEVAEKIASPNAHVPLAYPGV